MRERERGRKSKRDRRHRCLARIEASSDRQRAELVAVVVVVACEFNQVMQ